MKQRILGYRDRFDTWLDGHTLEIIGVLAVISFCAGSIDHDFDWIAVGGILAVTMVFALGAKVMSALAHINRSLGEIHRTFEESYRGQGELWKAVGVALEAAARYGHPAGPWTCECGQANRPGRNDCVLCDKPKP